MVEIPDSLRSVFSATVHERDGSYVFEIPDGEVEQHAIDPDGTYRIAVFPHPGTEARSMQGQQTTNQGSRGPSRHSPSPPVDEGEVRQVTIETVGDQGDGIAKVERGYVVIVSGAQPGEQPTVEIDSVRENVAFASVVDQDPRTV